MHSQKALLRVDATRAIRAREQSTGLHQMIVAMTAHAMKGDNEMCLAAGMDGYLSKPIRSRELDEKLQSLFGSQRQPFRDLEDQHQTDTPPDEPAKVETSSPTVQPTAGNTSTKNIVDRPREKIAAPTKRQVGWRRALQNVGDNPKLLRELVQLFLADLPDAVETLKRAVKQHNGQKLRAAAHTLKGTMLFLHTKDPYQNSLKLEQFGEQNKLDECEVVFEILRRDLATLTEELNWFLEANVEESDP